MRTLTHVYVNYTKMITPVSSYDIMILQTNMLSTRYVATTQAKIIIKKKTSFSRRSVFRDWNTRRA